MAAVSRPVLTECYLAATADWTPALDPLPMRPWSRERMLAAVLDLHMNAKTRAEREVVQRALGAIQVLDSLTRLYNRPDE
ncbi:hypothetical protein ACSRUE_06215 [Sorangium sp. KYC3313]|uniref:hypothetical protein n=1 Tax=Sorangium sp. KYC3313 TaxID=3449740 RepID=UPI003F89ADD4